MKITDRADFESRLGLLGFVLGAEDGGSRTWSGRVRAAWRDDASGERRTHAHGVKIVLLQGFPFRKPEVIPTDTSPPIVGQRHQAPGPEGALCLYQDEGRGWMPEQTADDLVGRIRQWFVHYHKDDWPDRDRAPDLHLYFDSDGHRCLMVYGNDWHPPVTEKVGRFGVWQSSPGRAFAGNPTTGNAMPSEGQADRVLPQLGMAGRRRDRTGLWFRLKEEPRPYQTLGEMLREIDRCVGWDAGSARQQVRFLMGDKVPRRNPAPLTLALGYPGDGGREQWLFIQAAAQPSGKNRRWSRAGDGIRVHAFEAAPAGAADLMRRTGHTAKQIRGRKVLLFGAGAIGSAVAMLLAKTGVEEMSFVDSDRVRPGNAVRNQAGLKYVGESKTLAIGLESWQHAPYCRVTVKSASWNQDELAQWVCGADVIVDATANEAFSLLLNRICLAARKPAVYAAAYRRATIGKVRVVRPGIDACKACYDYVYSGQPDYPSVPPGEEGSFIEGGCGVPTVEASAIDIEAVANVAARAVMHLMTEKQGEGSECIVVNEPLGEGAEVLSRLGTWWFPRPPATGCAECSNAAV